MHKFTDTLVYGLALGMGFKVGWEVVGYLLTALAGVVN
jgi:RsiW-degrading membrane proteinase PrsW (M82 family)